MNEQWWLAVLNYAEPYVDQLTAADALVGFIATVITALVSFFIAKSRWKAQLEKLRKLALEITLTEQEVLMLDLKEVNTAISNRRAQIETNINFIARKIDRIAELETKIENDKATKRRIDQLRPQYDAEIKEAKSQVEILKAEQATLAAIRDGAIRERGRVTGKLREHQKRRSATYDA